MKNNTAIRTAAFATIAAAFGFSTAAAQADTVKAKFTYTLSKSIDVTSPVSNGTVNTVKFAWTRTDAPGAGIDSTVPNIFNTYCVDLAQYVSANTNYTYNVVSPAAHGFTANQDLMLSRLWGTNFSNIDTADESAAFQVAVWEIVYDTNFDLSSGAFKVNTSGAVRNLAQSWINTITDVGFVATGTLPSLAVLESSTAQDQLTVVPGNNIPAAGSGVLALAGLSILGKRRNRR